MTKSRLIIIGCFLLAFAAGAALGALVVKMRQPPPATPRHSLWEAELNLTPQQKEMERAIADELLKPFRDRSMALMQERGQRMDATLSDSQKAARDAIRQEYSRKMEELALEQKPTFEEAGRRLREILTPEQAAKYDKILKERSDRGKGMPLFRGQRRRTASGPASQTAIDERPTSRAGE